MRELSAVITGAAGGIGQALCRAFLYDGWRVIAVDKNAERSTDCHSYVDMDLAQLCIDTDYAEERLRALWAEIPDGRLNGLINNAAIQIVSPFEDLSIDDWRQTIDTNLLAPVMLTRRLLMALEDANGAVLNVASIHARLTKPNLTAYATSKAALVGLTRSLAVELGGRVRVNAICPAAIATTMLSNSFARSPQSMEKLGKYHPCDCIGTPEEVAKAALYLVGEGSPFLNGAVLNLDGGIGSQLHDPF